MFRMLLVHHQGVN